MTLKTIRNIIICLIALFLVFALGYDIGRERLRRELEPVFSGGQSKPLAKPEDVDLTLFWDVWSRLGKYYIDKKAVDTQKMIYGAIGGMVASVGDPYTVFLPPQQNKEAKDDLGGKFEGIGVQLGIKDKRIVVVAPLKGTPADKAGLRAGDMIQKVDGKETDNWTLPEAVAKIRGLKGTEVLLSVYKADSSSSAEIKVRRDTINVASVEYEDVSFRCDEQKNNCHVIREICSDCRKVAYLKLSRFGDNTGAEWDRAVKNIKKNLSEKESNRLDGLVFDLRNNPGGYLAGSVVIASEFLKDGTVIIQDSVKTGRETFSVNRKGNLLDIPMVVLVNKGTASAGEIVAGALKERGRATLVGDTTFGKGSVQESQDLPGGAGIHITVAKWLLPSGKWINSLGVEPDVKVSNEETKPDQDIQLERAIEILWKK